MSTAGSKEEGRAPSGPKADGSSPADTEALYAVLHDLASRQLRRSSGASLNTTALAHEAWIKLARRPVQFVDRAHFLAVAATVMRQVIVDCGRRRRAQKRDGGAPAPESALSKVGEDARLDELLAVDEALDRLAVVDERLVRVVLLRFYAGLEEEEIAQALDVHVRTVRRDWRKARAFILSQITGG